MKKIFCILLVGLILLPSFVRAEETWAVVGKVLAGLQGFELLTGYNPIQQVGRTVLGGVQNGFNSQQGYSQPQGYYPPQPQG